jgi:predicted acetyltransferase
MDVAILPASLEDKSLVRRMMELYLYDFSEFDQADLDQHGCFGYPYLDHYWTEDGRHPFLVRVDGRLAGFVLVNQHTWVKGNERAIGEFFILKKYRRQGVGKKAAFHIFDRFPGKWEIGEMASNLPAQQFWRKVVREYTGGHYEEVVLDNDEWKGPVQYFDNRSNR